MAYVSVEQYIQYTGEEPPDDFDLLADMADTAVDRVTMYRLRGRDLRDLPDAVQTDIARTAALQVQFLISQGGISAVNDTAAPNMALGKFSYSGDTASRETDCPMLPELLAFVCAYLRGL